MKFASALSIEFKIIHLIPEKAAQRNAGSLGYRYLSVPAFHVEKWKNL